MSKALTKQHLVNCYMELAESMPIDKISVQNIVDKSNVNRNTFYYHFEDISALLRYIFDCGLCTALQNHKRPFSSSVFPELANYITKNQRFYSRILFSKQSAVIEKHIFQFFYQCCRQDFIMSCEKYQMAFDEDFLQHNISYFANACYQTVINAVKTKNTLPDDTRIQFMEQHRNITATLIDCLIKSYVL